MSSILQAIGAFGSFSVDIIILGIIAIVLFLYALYFGKNKLITAIISFYTSIVIYDNFAFLKNILIFRSTAAQLVVSRLIIFVVVFALVFATLKNFIHGEFSYRKSGKILQAVLLSLSIIDLLLILFYYIIPIQELYNFSPVFDSLFSGTTALFWWLIVPLIALFISRK